MSNNKFTSLILLLLLGFIWGTGYSIARFATTHGVSPLGYSFWQSLGPAVFISLLSCITSKSYIQLSAPHIRYYLICGLTGIVIPNTNMYFAAPHLPAGLLALIVNTVPIIAYPLALLARVESFSFVRLTGLISAICGLMLIILPKTSLPSQEMSPWVVSTLITPLSFAFCAIYISRYRPDHGDSFGLAAGTLIASSLLLLPLVCFNHHFYALHWPLTMPDGVIILEIILSSIGYVLLFQLIKIAGPVYYSLVDTVVALTGLFWGYLIFHEELNRWTGAAVLLILFALLLVTHKQRRMTGNSS
ncbi:MAG: DMT family transporter [Gammaproteobacteria bacterium]